MPILSWLSRDRDIGAAYRASFRLLEEVPELAAGDLSASNFLIRGDNLDGLKALLPYCAGRVKCIYIDPPYNTRSAFEQYDDNLEHSEWLGMIWPRLELLRELLSEDGSIWISIDDHEAHYLKVIMDEIFGRSNFIAAPVWQKRYSRENREAIGDVHEYLLVYARNPTKFKETRNRVPLNAAQAKIYRNPDNPGETDPKKRWRGLPMTAQGYRPNQMYTITAPNGKTHTPPGGRCWSMIEPEFDKLKTANRIYWGKDGNAQPSVIRFLSEVEGLVPWTWWPHDEVGHTDEAKKECNTLFGTDVSFDTPKPERLIERILHIATNPGDLVLDSFLGSGTTCAVAHKMSRRYIGIEMGDHAISHCVPRLKKVIDGEQGGISVDVGWRGGGGFRFFNLGSEIFDAEGHVHPNISFSALAAHIWFTETGQPWRSQHAGPFLGIHAGRAYALLYNGILGDKRPKSGNVLTRATLGLVQQQISLKNHGFDGPIVVFGEQSRLGPTVLAHADVDFRQTPYDIKVRR
jgi:adenine-specific DNA-methyltransferase